MPFYFSVGGGTLDVVDNTRFIGFNCTVSNDAQVVVNVAADAAFDMQPFTFGENSVLTKTGAGTLQLSGANTFASPLSIEKGQLRITNGDALGSTAGATTVRGDLGGKLLLSGTFTSDEPLILGGDLNDFGLLRLENGNVTLAGPVTMVAQTRVQTGGGKTLTFTGGITGNGNGLLVVNPDGGTIAFVDKPIRIPGQTLYFDRRDSAL